MHASSVYVYREWWRHKQLMNDSFWLAKGRIVLNIHDDSIKGLMLPRDKLHLRFYWKQVEAGQHKYEPYIINYV